MAASRKATTDTPPAPVYEDDVLYAVQLSRMVTDSPVGVLSPGKENHLRGWICNLIADAIADAQPV